MIAEVTMEISFTSSLPLIFLMMTGATAQGWGVKYSSSSVCAVKGSTVKFSCDVEYPPDQELKRAFWTKRAFEEHPELCSEERVQCSRESKDRLSITLRDVREADKHIYYCRSITNAEGGRYTGIPGVLPNVTDLQVETEQMVKEGDPVTMTCRTSCSLPPRTRFFWFREDQILPEQTKKKLQLQSARPSDTGFYQCAAVGAEDLRSPPVYLGVGRVEGLVESGVIYSSSSVCALKGTTVKITCSSSEHNILISVWTKPTRNNNPDLCLNPGERGIRCIHENNRKSVSFTLSDVTEADRHIFYCGFKDHRNRTWRALPGARLDVTDLQVKTEQMVKEGDPVTMTCRTSCSLPSGTRFIWFREDQILPEQTNKKLQLQSAHLSDTGFYQCAAQEAEHLRSPPVYLGVGYPPKNILVSISGSPEVTDGHSVTLICSTDSNPPPHTYTWFKEALEQENISLIVGSGQSLIISSFNSSHSGQYSCEAQNKYGSRRSETVLVSLKELHEVTLLLVTGVVVGCRVLIILIVITVVIKKKRRDDGAGKTRQNQTLSGGSAAVTNDVPVFPRVSSNQVEEIYTNVTSKNPSAPQEKKQRLILRMRFNMPESITSGGAT